MQSNNKYAKRTKTCKVAYKTINYNSVSDEYPRKLAYRSQ